MFRIPRPSPFPPTIDLSTVRETLLYMQDDMRRVPGLERVAQAIEAALGEIDVAERQAEAGRQRTLSARFMPTRLL